MLYTTVLKAVVRTFYGEPPATAGGAGAGLVVVADGVGGLDLCGTALRYVVPEAPGYSMALHPWVYEQYTWPGGSAWAG